MPRPKTAPEDSKLQKAWDSRYAELKKYHKKHGHVNVSQSYGADQRYRVLGCWVTEQRRSQQLGRLTKDRKARLDKLEFVWNLAEHRREQEWKEKFEELKRYKTKHGNCMVPATQNKPSSKLGAWVVKQRKNKRSGKIRADRLEKLENLGFVWDCNPAQDYNNFTTATFDRNWNEKYLQLQKFYEENGHSEIKRDINEKNTGRRQLQNWVKAQRRAHNQGILRADRKEKLDEVKFIWRLDHACPHSSANQRQWNGMFDRLLIFKKKHNHVDVPNACPEDPELGRWVSTQRHNRIRGKLDPRRQERLESVDFLFKKGRSRTTASIVDDDDDDEDESKEEDDSQGTDSEDDNLPIKPLKRRRLAPAARSSVQPARSAPVDEETESEEDDVPIRVLQQRFKIESDIVII